LNDLELKMAKAKVKVPKVPKTEEQKSKDRMIEGLRLARLGVKQDKCSAMRALRQQEAATKVRFDTKLSEYDKAIEEAKAGGTPTLPAPLPDIKVTSVQPASQKETPTPLPDPNDRFLRITPQGHTSMVRGSGMQIERA
jgi:hypothetical protein